MTRGRDEKDESRGMPETNFALPVNTHLTEPFRNHQNMPIQLPACKSNWRKCKVQRLKDLKNANAPKKKIARNVIAPTLKSVTPRRSEFRASSLLSGEHS